MLATRISGPVAVIGDVHGQTEKLSSILEQLSELPGARERWIVFIGDLVDRGPDSSGAMEMVAALLREGRRATVVSGNHELAMSGALGLVPAPAYAEWAKRWMSQFGAESTFASYGVPFGDLEALGRAVPEEHKAILAEAPWCVEHEQFFFVHAGLDPHLPFEAQKAMLRQRDFSLNSPGWLFSKRWPFESLPPDCNKIVVSGHVPVPVVQMDRQRVLTDTTGGVGGDLSCVLLPEGRVITSADAAPAKTSFFKMPKFFGRRATAH